MRCEDRQTRHQTVKAEILKRRYPSVTCSRHSMACTHVLTCDTCSHGVTTRVTRGMDLATQAHATRDMDMYMSKHGHCTMRRLKCCAASIMDPPAPTPPASWLLLARPHHTPLAVAPHPCRHQRKSLPTDVAISGSCSQPMSNLSAGRRVGPPKTSPSM